MIKQSGAKTVVTGIGVSITSSLSAFVTEALSSIVIFLIAILALIVADLFSKLYEIYECEPNSFRFSKGVRDTLAKTATYFAAIVSFVFLGTALHSDKIVNACCGLICFGEICSIAKHLLRVKGYEFNALELVKDLFRRKTGAEMPEDIIKPTGKDN